tara:strand:- start:1925 stop:5188 length:3264 start_codon:yes stop_codon:yes gene_type:complete
MNLIRKNNLADVYDISCAKKNLGLGSLSYFNCDDVNIEGGNIEIDSMYMKNTSFISSLPNIYISGDQYGNIYFNDADRNYETIPDWIRSNQNEVNLNIFSNDLGIIFRNELCNISFNNDFRQLFNIPSIHTEYADIDKFINVNCNLNDLSDTDVSIQNLGLSEYAKYNINFENQTFENLITSNLKLPFVNGQEGILSMLNGIYSSFLVDLIPNASVNDWGLSKIDDTDPRLVPSSYYLKSIYDQIERENISTNQKYIAKRDEVISYINNNVNLFIKSHSNLLDILDYESANNYLGITDFLDLEYSSNSFSADDKTFYFYLTTVTNGNKDLYFDFLKSDIEQKVSPFQDKTVFVALSNNEYKLIHVSEFPIATENEQGIVFTQSILTDDSNYVLNADVYRYYIHIQENRFDGIYKLRQFEKYLKEIQQVNYDYIYIGNDLIELSDNLSVGISNIEFTLSNVEYESISSSNLFDVYESNLQSYTDNILNKLTYNEVYNGIVNLNIDTGSNILKYENDLITYSQFVSSNLIHSNLQYGNSNILRFLAGISNVLRNVTYEKFNVSVDNIYIDKINSNYYVSSNIFNLLNTATNLKDNLDSNLIDFENIINSNKEYIKSNATYIVNKITLVDNLTMDFLDISASELDDVNYVRTKLNVLNDYFEVIDIIDYEEINVITTTGENLHDDLIQINRFNNDLQFLLNNEIANERNLLNNECSRLVNQNATIYPQNFVDIYRNLYSFILLPNPFQENSYDYFLNILDIGSNLLYHIDYNSIRVNDGKTVYGFLSNINNLIDVYDSKVELLDAKKIEASNNIEDIKSYETEDEILFLKHKKLYEEYANEITFRINSIWNNNEDIRVFKSNLSNVRLNISNDVVTLYDNGTQGVDRGSNMLKFENDLLEVKYNIETDLEYLDNCYSNLQLHKICKSGDNLPSYYDLINRPVSLDEFTNDMLYISAYNNLNEFESYESKESCRSNLELGNVCMQEYNNVDIQGSNMTLDFCYIYSQLNFSENAFQNAICSTTDGSNLEWIPLHEFTNDDPDKKGIVYLYDALTYDENSTYTTKLLHEIFNEFNHKLYLIQSNINYINEQI